MLPFQVTGIVTGSTTDFDLFIETGAQMTLYARAPYHWARDEAQRLIDAGQSALYYVTRDRDLVEAYQLSHAHIDIGTGLPAKERLLKITDAVAELTKVLYRYQLSPSSMARAQTLACALVSCLKEDLTCIAALGKLAHHDAYTYFHGARVSAHTVAIALKLGESSNERLMDMALGGILHDVGKCQIKLEILNKPGALTQDEWALIKKHPLLGESMVEKSTVGHVPRQIILGHHERFDGSGYPHQLLERDLLEEVKIAAFADTYDALTTNRPYQESRSPFEALDLIKHRLLKNMHSDSYHAMVEILAMTGLSKIAV